MSIKYFILRLTVFATISFGWYFGLWIPTSLLSVWYLYHYLGYEFVFLGLLLDWYFMSAFSFPFYTTVFALALFIMFILKPRLRSNNQI